MEASKTAQTGREINTDADRDLDTHTSIHIETDRNQT